MGMTVNVFMSNPINFIRMKIQRPRLKNALRCFVMASFLIGLSACGQTGQLERPCTKIAPS